MAPKRRAQQSLLHCGFSRRSHQHTPTRNYMRSPVKITPLFHMLTYNMRGLSWYAKTDQSTRRRCRLIDWISRKMQYLDICFLQETRLYAHECHALSNALPHCKIYYNNHPDNTNKSESNKASTISYNSGICSSSSVSSIFREDGR